MTQQFHEGDEVEVWGANMYPWRKARIVCFDSSNTKLYTPKYQVQFLDGTRAVFDAEHIRAIPTLKELYGDNHGEAFES